MENGNRLLQAALEYARKGLLVFPLYWVLKSSECSCRLGKSCDKAGKHPLTPHGVLDATADVSVVEQWWRKYPRANIGIATGAGSGNVVLDIDPKNGGTESFANLVEKCGPLPNTRTIRTGGGGRHFVFKHPGIPVKNSTSKLGPGLDIRGDGGYVVAPPSMHASGSPYGVEVEGPTADMPDWLVRLATEDKKRDSEHAHHAEKIGEGARNNFLTSKAGVLRHARFSKASALAALRTFNREHCEPPLPDAEVEGIINSVWKYPEGSSSDTACRRPDLVCLADVAPEDVEWLLHPYIPIGKITVLEGDPAAGKTFIAIAICAALTVGLIPKFDGTFEQHSPVNVLYLTAEDGIGDTIRPRFDSLGGDANKMIILRGIVKGSVGSEQHDIVTLGDVQILDEAMSKVCPALVVIDPLQAYLGADVDLHRANEVRPVLAQVAGLAEKHECAVLMIRHLSKAQQGRALYRGLGSIDITAAARSVLLAGNVPDVPNHRAIAHLKSSLASAGQSIEYTIEGGKLQWVGLSDISASELAAPEMTGHEQSALEEAKEFLRSILKDGPKLSADVEAEGLVQGISKRTLYRARKALGIRSRQQGFKGPWALELPEPTVSPGPAQLSM